ncbi:MAG: prephenate dehydrogenase/arogenate dehydrogenase family protein [bacterium]|nr:prephenate dehydrogenase/arogenate dehydrogenase family protein [bacterium]
MRIAVVGTGLIGASLGLAWRACGHSVAGQDLDAAALEAAIAMGAFDEAVGFEEARRREALVLAVPLDAVCAMLLRLRDGAPNPALILDVASLQVPVLRAAGDLEGFVASHPMAGREGNGPAQADPAIFRGQPWIYQPGAAQEAALRLIGETGAHPVPLEAELHDRAVALTSHLPQLLAVALARAVARHAGEPGVAEVVGPGLHGALRLARAQWSMWGPLLAQQGARDAALLEELARELQSLAAALAAESQAELHAAFDEAKISVGDIFRRTK